MEFKEDEWLQLSGLQHFAFCRRQWALIHIEQQWAENYRTVDGHLMHEHVHDQQARESLAEMHQLYQRRYTPKVKPSKACNACSLKDLCLPKLMSRKKVSDYLAANLDELQ